jgi:methylated-DNA-protein-cysteine methyltransferase-like protein
MRRDGHPSAGTGLYARIHAVVARIPRGRVSSYGRIAKLAGGCGARQVGYALSALPAHSDVPWQRVVNGEGRISLRSGGDAHRLQRRLLEQEGVEFGPGGRIDLARFGWPDDITLAGVTGDLFGA